VNRTGLIQNRLRTIHRNLKTDLSPKQRQKRKSVDSGGPKAKSTNKVIQESDIETQVEPDEYENLVLELNGLSPKQGLLEIKQLIKRTLPHRNYLRETNNQSILKIYQKFGECDFLVKELIFDDF
jgi:hypothetical protein